MEALHLPAQSGHTTIATDLLLGPLLRLPTLGHPPHTHPHACPQLVHTDLKPENILLRSLNYCRSSTGSGWVLLGRAGVGRQEGEGVLLPFTLMLPLGSWSLSMGWGCGL